jgi:hypothetical protein
MTVSLIEAVIMSMIARAVTVMREAAAIPVAEAETDRFAFPDGPSLSFLSVRFSFSGVGVVGTGVLDASRVICQHSTQPLCASLALAFWRTASKLGRRATFC